MKLLGLLFTIGGLALLLMIALLGFSRADQSADSNMIAFASGRDAAHSSLYIMAADGSNVRPLAQIDRSDGWVSDPVWSPNGRWIAFTLADSTGAQIYRVRPNGRALQQLTNARKSHFVGSWSPDSQQIAYAAGENVFIMGADGGGQTQLTYDGLNRRPQWSPDGEWIVFLRKSPEITATFNLHRVRPDGSELGRLTPAEFTDFDPAWTADGEWIIFGSDLGTQTQPAYFRLRPDEPSLVRLDESIGQHLSDRPVNWSASGEWAVYTARVEGNLDVYRAHADGSDAVRLTTHDAEDFAPAWSPPMAVMWRGWVNVLAALLMLLVRVAYVMQENVSR